ncbi:GAF domain-containing protein [Rhodoferax sp. AJA081-3]|uniref:cache domain-containing protein n=1 Tax=Rhodoferax sp. AJA081-3 TaxID=2752316 RepID=UPI001ADEFAA0|nr:GAF domain-containing protein [Rhodoferax sp. AJA081-3]QTN28689.1 GAF domain-containing protein [Rhodoferax sp. AJA081-3]
MNTLAVFFALHARAAWALVVAASLAVALLAGWSDLRAREQLVGSQLQTEARRSSIEIMSTTLNGNLMGSVTLLGLIDGNIKQEATNGLRSIDANVMGTLSTVGGAFGAEGVFIVGEDGIVKTSWDRIDKPSTGLDVRFRPYYKKAMQGQTSVYAAISMARGDRALYFAAPIFSEYAKSRAGIGGVVARTNLAQVDALLKDRYDVAMLLSPQGVVFASSRPEWQGMVEGEPDAQRLAAIRELRQFGKQFDERKPLPLPIVARDGTQRVEGQRFAVAAADVDWNDPSGPWKLVLMSKLTNTAPWGPSAWTAAVAGVLTLLLGWMWLHLLRGRHTQAQANLQLQAYAHQQEANVAYRARLAGIAAQLQRCNTLADLAQVFLREVREVLGAVQGVLYVSDPLSPQVLQLIGSAACAEPPATTLVLGEGLLGQCALERRKQVIATPQGGVWRLRSGLGNTQAASLLLAPLVVQDALVGALELALLAPADSVQTTQFEELVALLATNVEIQRRNRQLQQAEAAP